MDKTILFVDDAVFARGHLPQLMAGAKGPRQWILVACAPRMTHRVSKWVSHSARENWRAKWFARVLDELLPVLSADGNEVVPMLAHGRLTDMTQRLRRDHPTANVIDARRPKVGVDLEPVAQGVLPPGHSGWALPGAMAGMGALLVLANELGD